MNPPPSPKRHATGPHSPDATRPPARGQKQKSQKKRHEGVATGDSADDGAGNGAGDDDATGVGAGTGVGQGLKSLHGHTTTMGAGGAAVSGAAVGDAVAGAAVGDAAACAAEGDAVTGGAVHGDDDEVAAATGGGVGVGSMGTWGQQKKRVHTMRVGTAGAAGAAGG